MLYSELLVLNLRFYYFNFLIRSIKYKFEIVELFVPQIILKYLSVCTSLLTLKETSGNKILFRFQYQLILKKMTDFKMHD